VRRVTHIAPPDKNGDIIGCAITQEGVIVYPAQSISLCMAFSGAEYATTTEVYPDSAGVTEGAIQDTLVLPFNDEKAVEAAFERFGKEIAAVLLEPVPANTGLILPQKGYLQFLREITLKHHSGKLPLPTAPDLWIEEQLRRQCIDVLPLQRPVLYRAGALPAIHKDPFDRVIAADALHRDLRVISPDGVFGLCGCKLAW
jgi:hypothetical protein